MAQGFAAGALFGLANLAVLALLVRAVVRVEGPSRRRALTLAAVKFPLVYAMGFVLLGVLHVDALGFLAGFTAILATLLVTVLVTGRAAASSKSGTRGRAGRA